MRTSDSIASLSAMRTSMVVRLFACDWMMALDSALMTKRGVSRQEQAEELALHLAKVAHLGKAAAYHQHGGAPRPGARIAFVAELGALGKLDRADEVGDVAGGRIVGHVRADADEPGFGEG